MKYIAKAAINYYYILKYIKKTLVAVMKKPKNSSEKKLK